MYGDYDTGSCEDCPDECATCESLDHCLTCETGYQLDFLNQCQPCANLTMGCATCEHDICLTCDADLFLDMYVETPYSCLAECEDKYFKDYDNTTCEPCADECAECDSYDHCLKCLGGYANVNGDCQ